MRVGPCPATLILEAEPGSGVVAVARCLYYRVVGQSASNLRRFMSESGPADATGVYDAYTGFDLRYRYKDVSSAAGCSTGPVTIELQLTHTLPEWAPPAGSSPEVVDRWNHFTARLSVHEAGHAEIALRAANELSWSFEMLQPLPTCADVRTATHDIFARIVERSRAMHLRYDRRTRHGKTQGSVFP
jgi:predicted secreted Zn-dependent protease